MKIYAVVCGYTGITMALFTTRRLAEQFVSVSDEDETRPLTIEQRTLFENITDPNLRDGQYNQ